jgi:phosphoglycolate phosphatase
MISPKLFIFDVDGTFRDSSRELNEGLSSGFASVGQHYPFTAKQVWNLSGIGKYNSRIKLAEALYAMNLAKEDIGNYLVNPDAEEKINQLVCQSLNDADKSKAEKICKISHEFSNSTVAHKLVDIFPYASGAVDLLKSKDYEVALLTNSSVHTVKRDFSHIDLKKFSAILGRESLQSEKPSGEGIKKILALTGFNKNEAIHVGDSVADIRAARNAGCKSIGLLSGSGLKIHIEKERPDCMFKNLWDLSQHFSDS